MAYVAAKTTIPVPKIHAYSLESNNVVRSPFIVMDYCKGQSLYELQFQKGGPSPNHTVEKVYQQLASVYLQLRQLEFPRIGALGLPRYSGQPPTESEIDGITVQSRPLSMNMALQHTEGYQQENVGLDCRPGRSLLYANEAFHTFTDTWLKFENGPFVLWHMDMMLQTNNILFDPKTLDIVAVLDWESSFVVPVQFLVPPVWLTGSGYGFMLSDLKWYDEEVEKFRRQVKSLELKLQTTTRPFLSDVWTGACDTATIVALLHADNTYESYWGVLFWKHHDVDRGAPGFDFLQTSKNFIIPLLERFMDSKGNARLLEQKTREQDRFWQEEVEYFKTKTGEEK